MSLTGIPLLVVVALTAVASAAATLWLWPRSGRWRVLPRTVGILLTEAAVVLGVGLAVNRSEEFYPSWAALAGDTGATPVTATPRAGNLDTTLAERPSFSWHPRDLPSWHLRGEPTVTVPAGYRAGASLRFPVVLVLRSTGAPARAVPGAVVVTLVPTAATTGASLATMLTALARDVRVTPDDCAVVAETGRAAPAGQLARARPAQVRAVAVPPASLASLGRTPPGTVVREQPGGWQSAVGWATAQLGPPLAAPLLLPAGDNR